MFDALARMATFRGRRVVVISVLLAFAAGALGSGVADRLDPYGADDPSTESVIARDKLEDAGYRPTSVIVLVNRIDVSSPQGQERVQSLAQELEADHAVKGVTGYLNTHSPAFVSRDGDSTYLAVSLKATEDDAIQDASERIANRWGDRPGIEVGGSGLSQQQVNEQVEK